MEWFHNLFFGNSSFWGGGVAHSVLILALVIALGIALGKLKIGGIRLGVTWILFVGIAFSHFGMQLNEHLVHFVKEFGLILFVYSIGLQVGPSFFSSFKKGGVKLNMLATAIVFLGVIAAYIVHLATGLHITTVVGILSGAVTNTPGLGAAQQAYADMTGIDAPDIATGYAVAYPHGVIVSTGGQIPNNLAMRLDEQHVNILGTSAKSIDNAEDREKFSAMLDRIGVDQPRWKELSSMEDINGFVAEVGFPVLVRPSYVLSGAAMNVCSNQEELERFLKLAANVSQKHPVVVSQFIEHAKEVEMDAVADHGEIVMYAISEHIEFAGVHSGDATIQFPAQKLYVETVRRIKRISKQIAKELNISGPFNIQYLAKGNEIKVIECNLRASRSFPFVSKVLKINFIELATRVMLGLPVEKPNKNEFDLDYVGIKASQFSFNRLQKADPVLGVDMASTGEVGCLGDDVSEAVLTSMLAVGQRVPEKNILLSTGTPKQKVAMLDAAKMLATKGYNLFATGGTHRFLAENGIPSTKVYWPSEKGEPQALKMLHEKQIDMVVNIPRDLSAGELDNGYKIRRAAIDLNIPLITNARLASAFIQAFCTLSVDDICIKSWQEYK